MSKRFGWLKKFALLLVSGTVFYLTPTRAAFINGQSYVSLADWARSNGLNASRTSRGDEMVLASQTTRLVFDVDSRYADINGVRVALSFPVANTKGALLIAQPDLETAIRPLVISQKLSSKRITTVCLDPGHGGKDTGNRVGWHYEKVYTLALAAVVRDQLEQAGFNVIMTRTRDTSVELSERPALANRRGADLFVSLHFNATPTGRNEVEGPETYCITPVGASSTNARGESGEFGSVVGTGPTIANRNEQKSLLLAYQIQKSLVRNLAAEDRGVRRARFAVLRDAAMPAILIEGGYMTHPVEGRKIFSDAYRRQLAQAIVKGILAYQKVTSPAVPPLPPATNRPAKGAGDSSAIYSPDNDK
ncbi:MAG: N-acetylmuramoyl-L-alanine amidase [Verrucomicrobiia bacterium]|jgi:N-acetylmuramoyl-L-alanine amidase